MLAKKIFDFWEPVKVRNFRNFGINKLFAARRASLKNRTIRRNNWIRFARERQVSQRDGPKTRQASRVGAARRVKEAKEPRGNNKVLDVSPRSFRHGAHCLVMNVKCRVRNCTQLEPPCHPKRARGYLDKLCLTKHLR